MNSQNMSFKCRTGKTGKFAIIAMMFTNIFVHSTHMGFQCWVGRASVVTRFALVSFIDGSVNISHMRHQFRGICEGFAAHGTFAGGQWATFFGVALHVPVNAHFGSSFEFTETTLEFFDGDLVHTSNMLFQKSAMFGDVTALSALITRLSLE